MCNLYIKKKDLGFIYRLEIRPLRTRLTVVSVTIPPHYGSYTTRPHPSTSQLQPTNSSTFRHCCQIHW